MEAKLKEYRSLRRRKELLETAKAKVESTKEKLVNFLVPKIFREMEGRKEEEVVLLENEEIPEPTPCLIMEESLEAEETSEPENQESWRYFTIKWFIFSTTWIGLYIYFLSVGFGAVFFVISALVGIYLNTRTKPRKMGEISAYSVFNKNCVSIDGTLKAEQFEREIRYGAGSVR